MRIRARAAGLVAVALLASALVRPIVVVGAEPDLELTATLDGKPIPVSHASKYYCDDFSYPVIQCSRSELITELRAMTASSLTGVDYVTIFDQPSYAGSWMHVSEDYGALLTIGWNDKISSFRGRNSETGRFWTDWFNGGTAWNFCCNSWVPSLGSFNNTFSSVQRT